ncbi:unnamed protein product [Cuscuta campestris]|uniref:Reticulon-like protein n=1 Tax=Cuscuta campestris TaxID=132261 RepID=A0A484NJH3_9ASTE|nr:unnamed protein product [Cuscuta campestris]
MNITPQSSRSSRLKSSSRLSKLQFFDHPDSETLTIVPSPSPPASSPKPPDSLPIRDILLLSPSIARREKILSAEKLGVAEDGVEVISGGGRRSRSRNAAGGGLGCASPRIHRRSRRRLDLELMKEERNLGGEEGLKPRKKRHSGRYKKDKLGLVPVPSPKPMEEAEGVNLDRIGEQINDLVMWRDVARSSLLFGFGSLCFLSSCFSNGVTISIVSLMSHVGLLLLVVSFFLNSFRPRYSVEGKLDIRLKEEDIQRFGRLILPTVNLVILKTRELFSGEPGMTLKVVPFLIVGAECGHLLSLWRLCAFGFFISFTVPKLYSSYSSLICRKVESLKYRAIERWGGCSHKKTIAASALTAFWNLSTARTRIFAAFICIAVIRYGRQKSEEKDEEQEREETLKGDNIERLKNENDDIRH